MEKLCFTKIAAAGIRRTNGLPVIFCVLAVRIDVITETLANANLAFFKPFILLWAAEVAHHVIHMVAAIFTGGSQVRHS